MIGLRHGHRTGTAPFVNLCPIQLLVESHRQFLAFLERRVESRAVAGWSSNGNTHSLGGKAWFILRGGLESVEAAVLAATQAAGDGLLAGAEIIARPHQTLRGVAL